MPPKKKTSATKVFTAKVPQKRATPKKAPRKKTSATKSQTTKPMTRVTKKNLDDIANDPEDPVEDPIEDTKERKVKQISQLEHAKRKSMWVGSKKIQTTEMYCL